MPANRVMLLWAAMLLARPAGADELSEQFWAAARRGDAATVKALLAKGVDVNTKFRYGATALSYAADRGHFEVVKVLLEQGADANVRDTFYDATPLTWAASKGQMDVVKMLLEKGANGEEVLLSAVSLGRGELVKMVLDLSTVSAETLSSCLAIATRNRREEIAELLKKAGATPLPEANFPVGVEILKSYEGLYRSERGMEFRFAVKDGKLTGGPVGRNPGEMGAISNTSFRPADSPEETITFHEQGGKVTGFTSRRGPIRFAFQKVEGK